MNKTVKDYIRTIVDFPHEGILFRDVTTLFADARGFRMAIDQLLTPYAGLRITPRGLLSLGQLMLGGGLWQGRQLVPAAWVSACLQPVITVGKGPLSYGHQWWSGPVEAAGRTLTWTAGFGNGGQRLFIVPDLDLAVVMTAGQYNSGSIGGQEMRLFRRIVATL